MYIIDRYLLRHFVQTFVICFLSLMGLWVVIEVTTNLQEFIRCGRTIGRRDQLHRAALWASVHPVFPRAQRILGAGVGDVHGVLDPKTQRDDGADGGGRRPHPHHTADHRGRNRGQPALGRQS